MCIGNIVDALGFFIFHSAKQDFAYSTVSSDEWIQICNMIHNYFDVAVHDSRSKDVHTHTHRIYHQSLLCSDFVFSPISGFLSALF